MNEIKNIIQSCIRQEIEALKHLSKTIDETDILFVKTIACCKGNIIITGIGKSYAVGRKIAGTLSSIGMPAISVSTTDMLHGNIGMLRKDDILLLISNSGETKEIIELAEHLQSIGNYTIFSITGNSKSTLAKISQLTKEIKVQEAGPFSIIPTSSTTAVMAYGDALAVALAHINGLSPEEFGQYHPGGRIGKKFNKIQ